MKAAYTKYGPPDVVAVDDLDKPVPKDNEILIRVQSASVNPLDWKTIRGGPYILRLLLGSTSQRSSNSALMWLAKLKRLAKK